MTSITVVTVAGPNDGPLIRKNADLIRRANPGAQVALFVIDNSRHCGGTPVEKDDAWTVIDGVSLDEPGIDSKSRASSQHGLALNRFFECHRVDSKYCLVLDPDFFILYPNWIEQVTTYMVSDGLALFGSPWHPKWFTKYRYFPCVHCLFIDTEQVEIRQLDFSPRLRGSIATEVQRSAIGSKLKKTPMASTLSLLYSISLLRLDIGKAKDTGSQMIEYLKRRPFLRLKLLVPYVRGTDFSTVRHLRHPVGHLIERIWPDRFSFIPKRDGYFTTRSHIPECFEHEMESLGWEEFQWRNNLFGVHMRRFANSGKLAKQKEELLFQSLVVSRGSALNG